VLAVSFGIYAVAYRSSIPAGRVFVETIVLPAQKAEKI
jgi:hypothetical protein